MTHKHVACGFMFYIVSAFQQFKFEPKFYRGKNTVHEFIRWLLKTKNEIMTIPQLIIIQSALCHLCEDALNGDKVRDHCHIPGKSRCFS